MDIITIMRIVATLASFVFFLGVGWWAYARRNHSRFDEAARLPFEQD